MKCLFAQFTGQERDAETGVDHFLARMMASMQGRFLSPDPANLGAEPVTPQSWNMYGYVRNSPLTFIDPSGLTTCDKNGNNCYDSVTVDGGSGDGLPIDCFFYSFLCGGGFPGPGITTQPPPPPPSKPPKPLFGQCMENHASDFSLAGFLDNGLAAAGRTNLQPGHTLLGSTIGGNNLTGAYFALFGYSDQSTGNAVTTAVNQGLVGDVGIVGAIGENLTAGRRTSSIISLNLQGKAGPAAQVLARSPALRKTLGRVGLVGKITTIIDAGLALGEALDCAVGALP